MREDEKRVHGADSRFTVVAKGTKPSMVPLIKEVCESRGTPQEAQNYEIGEAYEKRQSCRVHWVRSGEKERFETTPLDSSQGNPDLIIKAFNGKRVWTLASDPKKPRGSLQTVESGHWKTQNRINPFSFLFYYQDMPYSEIVEKSPTFEVGKEEVDKQTYTFVAIDHPKISNTKFKLFFDESHRLFQRQLLMLSHKETAFRVWETHRFLDWNPFENKEGASIDFPSQARYSYYMGVLDNGALIEYASKEVKIEQLVFNPSVSDAIFEQNIPANAEVWDGISKQRFLPPGERPEHLFPEDSAARWWWIKAVGISIFFLLVLLAVANRGRN